MHVLDKQTWDQLMRNVVKELVVVCNRCGNHDTSQMEFRGLLDDGLGLYVMYRCLICGNEDDVGDRAYFETDKA